jgi:hypothetical protein
MSLATYLPEGVKHARKHKVTLRLQEGGIAIYKGGALPRIVSYVDLEHGNANFLIMWIDAVAQEYKELVSGNNSSDS